MADYQQVQVDNSVDGENPSLEEQAAAMDAQEQPQQDRPEWLDEKFETPEAMAQAYAELQAKLGNTQEEEEVVEEAQEQETVPMTEAIETASKYYAENGELGEEQITALEQSGIPRHYIDQYLQGFELSADQAAMEVMNTVGGAESYQQMSEWASENLSESELNAYNDIVVNGDVEAAKMAVQGLYARWSDGAISAPNLLQGRTSGTGDGTVFNSAAQVTAAMRDPRYAIDPAYRAEVEAKIARSNVL